MENQDVRYELLLAEEEAINGASKILTRNGKRLQVNIPPGTIEGGIVKLGGALQTTDGRAGDILIIIRIKTKTAGAASGAPDGVVEIDDSSFDNEVLNSKLPVVVDFWAPWCGPCRMMAPIMDKAAKNFAGKFKFCKINVDDNPAKASQYQAMSIPLLIFFQNGQAVDKSLGAIPENQLLAKINSLL